jgi:hypothetical protein
MIAKPTDPRPTMSSEPGHRATPTSAAGSKAAATTGQLPDITVRLERELANLLAATNTPGPIADLWVTFAACQRSGIGTETTASPGRSARSHPDHSPRRRMEDCS